MSYRVVKRFHRYTQLFSHGFERSIPIRRLLDVPDALVSKVQQADERCHDPPPLAQAFACSPSVQGAPRGLPVQHMCCTLYDRRPTKLGHAISYRDARIRAACARLRSTYNGGALFREGVAEGGDLVAPLDLGRGAGAS